MIFYRDQRWRTTTLPFSLALKNTVNTGVSFDTPSGAIAQSQRFAAAGFRGLGQYGVRSGLGQYGVRSGQWIRGGLSGLGCGCGCCGGGSDGTIPLLLAAAALYF